MNKDVFIEKLLERAYSKGVGSAEVYLSENKKLSIQIFDGKVDKYQVSEGCGLGFRIEVGKQIGYSYTEIFDEKSIPFLIESAIDNATLLEREEVETIFEGSEKYSKLVAEDKDFAVENIESNRKIDDLLNIEKHIRDKYDKIDSIPYLGYSEVQYGVHIKNTEGLNLKYNNSYGYRMLQVVSKDKEQAFSKYGYQLIKDYNNSNNIDLADKISKECIEKNDSKPIKSGEYKVVFDSECMSDLLSAFTNSFSAERVQKHLSFFENKLNDKVASDKIQIIDDPFFEKAYVKRIFDDEGVAMYRKQLIKDGVLVDFMHNRKTAEKWGVKSTGNGAKSGYKGVLGVSHSNFYIEPGKHSKEDMLKEDTVLLIKELEGLHAGLNGITGDFSLSAQGVLYENGIRKHSVNQITVAGNFFDMLKNVDMIGSDFFINVPGQLGSVGAPIIKFNKLQISGE